MIIPLKYPELKLAPGTIVITRNALLKLSQDDILTALNNHGVKILDDGRLVVCGTRLFSVHKSKSGDAFWVVTETYLYRLAILLPGETSSSLLIEDKIT